MTGNYMEAASYIRRKQQLNLIVILNLVYTYVHLTEHEGKEILKGKRTYRSYILQGMKHQSIAYDAEL